MNVGSLFAGIGGFDLGLERAGFRTVWQVEQSEFRRAVLARHFPDAERFEDVCTVGAHNLERVDLICGGFPCQDISLAGGGAGIDGARSGLWAEFARIIGEIGPDYAVVENVPALTARGLDRVLRDLAAIGYDAEWDCLPASAFGAPHTRDRIWIVAYPNRDGLRLIAERDQREGWEVRAAVSGYAVAPHDGANGAVADAKSEPERPRLCPDQQGGKRRGRSRNGSGPSRTLAHPNGLRCAEGLREPTGAKQRPWPGDPEWPSELQDADSSALQPWRVGGRVAQAGGPEWWAFEPPIHRVAHGLPNRLDRCAAGGDALIPQIAEWIGHRILAYEQGEPVTQGADHA